MQQLIEMPYDANSLTFEQELNKSFLSERVNSLIAHISDCIICNEGKLIAEFIWEAQIVYHERKA